MVIGTDCTGSCKSNYHTTTTTPHVYRNVEINKLMHCTYFFFNASVVDFYRSLKGTRFILYPLSRFRYPLSGLYYSFSRFDHSLSRFNHPLSLLINSLSRFIITYSRRFPFLIILVML